MKVWTYWENKKGTKTSPFQKLCFETMRLHNDFEVVGPKEVAKMKGGREVLKLTEGLPLFRRADLVRLWLVYNFGGIWVDSDCVFVAPIDPRFVEACKTFDLACVGHAGNAPRVIGCPFGARKGSPTIKEGLVRCKRGLERLKAGKAVPYTGTSLDVLTSLNRDKVGSIRRFEHWRLNPIKWNKARKVFQVQAHPFQHETQRFNPNACLYHLTNVIPDAFKDATREELLTGKTFMTFLFQKAFRLFPAVPWYSQEILNRLPEGPARMIEIGVFRGLNGRALLSANRDLEYTGVDPWASSVVYTKTGDAKGKIPCGRWPNIFNQARKLLGPLGERVDLIRKESSKALRQVKNRSVDLVFIDGNHSEPFVNQDLKFIRKVKPGGWIGGHDYGSPKEGKGFGVKAAVDKFAEANNLPIETGDGMTWFVKVPNQQSFKFAGT